MERHILAVCDKKATFNRIQQEWLKDGITTYGVSDFSEAVRELSKNNTFLLIIVFSVAQGNLSPLKFIRKMIKTPILIVKKGYSSTEKTAIIEAGADECIAWSDDYLAEVIASGHALIRRYTELNQSIVHSLNILSRGILFMNVNYRTAFIGTKELVLPRREFDLLYYLASNPGRVFTNEQLYNKVWGEDYLRDADNGLHSCLNRIRRKLEEIPDASCQIQNLRGVGYRFVQENIQ